MLVVLATHPIQYQVPIWRQLAERGSVPFEVWYLTDHGVRPSLDVEFGKVFKWDMNLLSGYPHRFPAGFSLQSAESLWDGGFWGVGLPADFRSRLKSGDITALFVQGWNVLAFWEAIYLAHKIGLKIWIRGDSNDLKRDSYWKGLMKRLLHGVLFRRIDRFLYVGAANRRLYESRGVNSYQLVPGLHAVDNARFIQQSVEYKSSRSALRRAWGIAEDAFCVLFVGKYISQKRPQDLIDALTLLKASDTTRCYHALFVGAGELEVSLRHQCNVVFDSESVSDAVHAIDNIMPVASFAGFMNQTEVSKAYVAADVLVLPSESETWGLVVNEALACGLPCIVSDACGSAEDLVMPLDTHLRFPAGDQLALAHAIKHSAEYPISPQAIKAHIAKFDFTVTVDTLEMLWHEESKT